MKKAKEPKVESNQVALLRDGLESQFWRTMKKILEAEKDDIQRDVFNRESLALTDKMVDDLIKWHNFLDYVIELPEKCIASLESQTINDGAEDQDPYEKNPIQKVREKIEAK